MHKEGIKSYTPPERIYVGIVDTRAGKLSTGSSEEEEEEEEEDE